MTDCYNSPEKFGLEVFDEVDDASSYEFNMTVVWRQLETGKLFYAQDSGCSCPSPFGGFGLGDLKPLNLETINEFKRELEDFHKPGKETMDMMDKVKSYLSSSLTSTAGDGDLTKET